MLDSTVVCRTVGLSVVSGGEVSTETMFHFSSSVSGPSPTYNSTSLSSS